MNDFTKEELSLILSRLDLRFVRQYNPDVEKLLDKIQSMIDKYSEMKSPPTMADYCCKKCNEEWHNCECKKCST